MSRKRIISLAICFAMALGLCGCGPKRPVIEPVDGWYATWAAAAAEAEYEQVPLNPSLRGSTCRQQIKVSVGGSQIRLTFSNEYGKSALELESVHIARLFGAGDPKIDVSTDTAVTFGGSESVTVHAGQTVTSDAVNFSFEALDVLAVTSKFGENVPSYPTCHPDAGCTSWIVEGNSVSEETFSEMELMSSWYFLTMAETWAKAGTETVVCFGDSVTDGAGATYNGFDSWPEALSAIMQADPATSNISVVGSALSGSSLFGDGAESVKERFERDVLGISGVHRVILLVGANDILGAQYDISEEMIAEYKKIIEECHGRGISVYAGTLTPFEGNTVYYSELHEKIRRSVNEFIASPDSGFDGYADFSQVLCYAENPSKMQSVYDSGDALNPNAAGCSAMAKAAAEMLRDSFAKEAAAKEK